MTNTAEIISRIENGDSDAFCELVKPYEKKLYTFLARLTGNREDAEELLQDTFIRIYRNLSRFDGRAAFQTWVYKIAINQFKSYKRKRRLKQVSLDEMDILARQAQASRSCDLVWEEKELKNEIRACISFLKPDLKAALIMKYLQGFSWQEIGNVLGVSGDAAKMKVFRARKEILKRFGRSKEVF